MNTFGPLWGPRRGSKNREKSTNFFCSKSLLKGPRSVWNPQNPKISPVGLAKGPLWGHFVCKMGHLGVKKAHFRVKNAKFSQIFFVPHHSWMVPGGPGTIKTPKLRLHGRQLGPFGANLCVKWAIWGSKTPILGSKNTKFSEICFCSG